MDLLDADETLILQVAKATCFTHRLDPKNTPREDLDSYIDELLSLYNAKPGGRAVTHPSEPEQDVRGTLVFCAEQLSDCAPDQAQRLRQALAAS